MTIEVTTKDCATLDDVELAEMADMTASSVGWEAGLLSKQAEEWVLVSQAVDAGSLIGFVFTTLERIGGTPAMIIGLASVTKGRTDVMSLLMDAQYHKALMAFPDEDVLISMRAVAPAGYAALERLTDVRPWPGVKANGEERAWGRRLSKRYGAIDFDDRAMVARGDGEHLVVDCDPTGVAPDAQIFDGCQVDDGEYLIAWGWAMAEFLEELASA